MEKFDVHFIFEHGRNDLQECTNMPTKEHVEETLSAFADFGLGKLKQIVIDNIVFKNGNEL